MSLESARDDLVAAANELDSLSREPMTSDSVYSAIASACQFAWDAVGMVDEAKELT